MTSPLAETRDVQNTLEVLSWMSRDRQIIAIEDLMKLFRLPDEMRVQLTRRYLEMTEPNNG